VDGWKAQSGNWQVYLVGGGTSRMSLTEPLRLGSWSWRAAAAAWASFGQGTTGTGAEDAAGPSAVAVLSGFIASCGGTDGNACALLTMKQIGQTTLTMARLISRVRCANLPPEKSHRLLPLP
jgi:hypothetical protein